MAVEEGVLRARAVVYDNIKILRDRLINCVDEEMIDLGNELYNTTFALTEDDVVIETWDEMDELVQRVKKLEKDIDVWLARHGQTSLSLTWPTKEST